MKIAYDIQTRRFGIFDFLRKGKKMDKKAVVHNTLESLLEGGLEFNDVVSFFDLARCKPSQMFEKDFICFPVRYNKESNDQTLRKWLDKDELKFVLNVKRYLSQIEKKAPLVKKRGELIYDADVAKEEHSVPDEDIKSAGYKQVYELNGMLCLVGWNGKEYVFVSEDDVTKWITTDLSFPQSTILELIDIPMLDVHFKSFPKEREKWLEEQLSEYNKIRASRGLPETDFPK